MAYDPEARRQSNSAMIIALVSALVLGGGLLAYMATRNNTPEPGPTTVINSPARERTVVVTNNVPVPVPAAPSAPNVVVREVPQTVVVQPGAPATNTTIRTERNSTTVRERVVAPRPAANAGTASGANSGATNSNGSAAPAPQSNTNVTINNAPPATSDSTEGSTSTDNAASADSGTAPASGSTNSASSGY